MTETKNILLAILLMITFDNGLSAQSAEKYNSIHIEFYQPLRIPAMGEFYSDDWYFGGFPSSMSPDSDFERNNYSGAFGLRYDRILKKGFILKTRLGMSYRKLTEHFYSDYHNYQDGGSDDYILDQTYSYSQFHVNAFLGGSKRIILSKRFFIDVGPQLAYVRYMQSDSKFTSHTDDYAGTSSPVMIHNIQNVVKYNPVNFIGVGSKAELSMRLTDKLTSTLGFQAYCFLMRSKGTRVTNYQETSQDIPNGTTNESSKEWRLHQKIKQTGFSNVSPVVSIGYNF